FCQLVTGLVARTVVVLLQQGTGQPQVVIRKVAAQQLTVRRVGLSEGWQPQCQCMAYLLFHILPVQLVAAFFTAATATGNQCRDLAVGGLVRRQQDQVQWRMTSAVQKETAAD